MTPRQLRFFKWELIIMLGATGAAVTGASIAAGNFFVGLLTVTQILAVVGVLLVLCLLPSLIYSAWRRRRDAK